MNSSRESILLDSNILIYAEQEEAPQHQASKALRDQALTGEISACISPQNLYEFFAVVTNARRVSAPLTQKEAADQIRKYSESKDLKIIYPGTKSVERMVLLLDTHTISGAPIHDLHLIATMLENGIKQIYTYNTSDFDSFSEIEAKIPPEPKPVEIEGGDEMESEEA